MTRLARAAFWLLPPLFFLWFYKFGLRAWFQQDDFAWLGLGLDLHSWRDLPAILFQPQAQGTIRPLSERLFFLVLFDRFNLDPRPYHAVVAVFQLANIALLQSLTLRLSGSRLAAFVAPLVWLCGAGLATPLSWLSAFNQVLCAFFLMASLLALHHAIESKRTRDWIVTWILFLLGFGALEVNIVFPALALSYLLLYRRDRWRISIPFFAVSGLYAIVHFTYAAKPKEGDYARHWDLASLVSTLDSHLVNLLSGGSLARLWTPPLLSPATCAWLLGVLTVSFLAWAAWKRAPLPLFGLSWFFIALAPVLPLRDHVTDYYLAIPSIGWAWIAGAAVAGLPAGLPAGLTLARGIAAVAVFVHLLFAAPVNRLTTKWRHDRGQRIRVLVEGLERAHQLHPGKTVLLTGLDDELQWSALSDEPQRLFGLNEVYLAPGAEKSITPMPQMGDLDQYVYPPSLTARAVFAGKAVVYAYEPARLRNVTRSFRSSIPPEWDILRPSRLELGQDVAAGDLGPGWYGPEGSFRWMSQRATVYLSRSKTAQNRLIVNGYVPVHLFGGESPTIRVQFPGAPAFVSRLANGESMFTLDIPVPPATPLNTMLEIRIDCDRTVRSGQDVRPLSIAVRRIGFAASR